MDLLNNLAVGFATALSLQNLLYCFLGVTLGTLIGVLPGLGPVATLAMLLPITYTLDPTSALIMLAGIYYGSQYGGSTTAILVNLPGESASVVTCLDGYQMARQGKAGTALGIAAIGSFIAGCFATILVAAFAPPLIELAFKFGPAEYFSLMVLGLVGAVVLANGSVLKAFAMIILGLLLGIIGADVNSGTFRFDFGIAELQDGIDFVAISMGLFGFTEIIVNLSKGKARDSITEKVGSIRPSRKELCKAAPAITRGTLLGSFLGILPGGGALLASFASYTLEKKVGGSHANPPFGKGNIAGVAGPESANNAGAQTSFIPMLTLGIPWQRHDGADDRRPDDSQHHTGTAGNEFQPHTLLGAGGFHVDRQPDACHFESAFDRCLGSAAARALRTALPDDSDFLLHRRLFH